MIRVVFFGTSEESVYALRALLDDERFEVAAVVTQPPRAVGRHQELVSAPVERIARDAQVEVLTPERPIDALDTLHTIAADVFVVVSYGHILPQAIVDLPLHGSINIHPSLLPKWRGATPVPATIKAGDAVSGVTIIKMDEKMDHGSMIDQVEADVPSDATTTILLHDLMRLGAKRLPNVLVGFVEGTITPTEQNHAGATFCSLLKRDDGRIDWTRSAEEIERMVRAYDPWPGTWTEVQDGDTWKRLKILAAHIDPADSDGVPGDLMLATDGHSTRVGRLVIDRLQFESKKPVPGTDLAATLGVKQWALR